MSFLDNVAILIGKVSILVSRFFKLGYGGTWPGEIALTISPDILKHFSSKLKMGMVLVAGTNGKTTTSLMLKSILETAGFRVIHNISGANLLNGLVSAFINSASLFGHISGYDIAVFEIDENTLPLVVNKITPLIVICLNLFRDQLDRYGEVDVIADKWNNALTALPSSSTVILNSDDPQIAYLAKNLKAKVIFFGVNDPSSYRQKLEHATDSIFCLACFHRLHFSGIYFSHLGIWKCDHCGLERPKPDYHNWQSPLPGFYNRYNFLAAVAAASQLTIRTEIIKKTLKNFSPAFGRQEQFKYQGKQISIFLSKNPAGFNESLKTVISLKAATMLIVLNDNIPDGRDVSWIWDVDFENLPKQMNIILSGTRVFDLALRLHYSGRQFITEENLENAINKSCQYLQYNQTLFCLPTYSAMLEIRKIITGKKIL